MDPFNKNKEASIIQYAKKFNSTFDNSLLLMTESKQDIVVKSEGRLTEKLFEYQANLTSATQ